MSGVQFHHLTKRYGPVTAVDDLTVDVAQGRVTAFLGVNGSGKTTSMRALLGLTPATAGGATIDGVAYRELPHPGGVVGAVLDQAFHPNRRGRTHLRIAAQRVGAPRERADRLLEQLGLAQAGGRRVGGYSLGMRQRLALATALVGDPRVLVLDEPFNGLDPIGIADMRSLLRAFASSGGTVFVSSHLLSEVAHVADDAVIIHAGRLVTAGPLGTLVSRAPVVVVASPDAGPLGLALSRRGAAVEAAPDGTLTVTGLEAEEVGRTAVAVGAVVTGLREPAEDLENAFRSLIETSTRAVSSTDSPALEVAS